MTTLISREKSSKKIVWKTRENVGVLSKLNFWTKIWLLEWCVSRFLHTRNVIKKYYQFRSDYSLHFSTTRIFSRTFKLLDMRHGACKCQISRKKCIQHRLTNCLGRENTNCINQFRVNLSVNKLIVFCYALKSSKIFWCWSQIIVTIEALMWSFQSEKIFFCILRSVTSPTTLFLVFVLSMSWQRLRSRTRIVCATIYSWLKKYAFYSSNSAKHSS